MLLRVDDMALTLWIPRGGRRRPASVPPEGVEQIRAAMVHEAGHLEVARHFGYDIIGVALQLVGGGVRPIALNRLTPSCAEKEACTVWGGGSASELLYFGEYSAEAAREDMSMVQTYSDYDYDELVTAAKAILTKRRALLEKVISILQSKFDGDLELNVHPLENHTQGALILRPEELP
jgi:hypothetical protein